MENNIFVVDVTDDRGFYLIKALQREGLRAYIMQGGIIADGRKVYIFSLAKELELNQVEELEKGSIVFARVSDFKVKSILNDKGIKQFNFLDDNRFLMKNAYITAEGALSEIIQKTKVTIMNMPILILGYGRIGKCLARMLKALNAKVTVASKPEKELAEAEVVVENTIELDNLSQCISSFKVIVNTIPLKIIKGELVGLISEDTFILDLASKPGGVDFMEIKGRGLSAFHFLGVPGKISPQTAAEYLKESLIRSLKEI
ncbi:MAG: NAD(P)-dependent oxidoreductase [Bacillota bacterium]